MKRREFGKNIAALGIGATLVTGASALTGNSGQKKYAVSIGDSEEQFPRSKGMAFSSSPVFVLTRNGQTEVLKFDGNLHMQSRMAKKNKAGFRYIELQLDQWEASAHSKLLGRNVQFKMVKVRDSKVTSLVLNQDFPAKLDFVIDYDILSDGQIIEPNVTARGTAIVNSFNHSLSNVKLDIDSTLPGVLGNSDIELKFVAA